MGKRKKKKTVRNPRSETDRRIRQADRAARVLRVLELLLGRGRWNAKEIAAEIGCHERTVYRDLDVLKFAGVPYYFDNERDSYCVRPGWQFPVPNLTPDEVLGQAVATAATKLPGLGIGRGAESTTRKIAAKSPEKTQQLLHDAERLIAVLDLKLADHSGHLELIKTIQWALLARKQLLGEYVSPYQQKPVKLTLHPYRLCLIKQAWYLIARPTDRDAPRTYRATRFRSLRMLDALADVPEEFDLQGYLGNAWAVYRGNQTYEVAVQFTKDAADLVTETTWHPTQSVHKNQDGTVTLGFTVDGLDEIVWWVLAWSGRAKVLKPEELRVMVAVRLREALVLNEK